MDYRMPRLGIERWEQVVQEFNAKYSGLIEWQNRNFVEVCKKGWLQNPTGRILTFKRYFKKGAMEYKKAQVCNFPVQSLATADIMKLVMVVAKHRILKEGLHEVKFINQVHDSIILDAPTILVDRTCRIMYNVFQDIPKLFENYFGLEYNVPMAGDCKFGETWSDLTKWKP